MWSYKDLPCLLIQIHQPASALHHFCLQVFAIGACSLCTGACICDFWCHPVCLTADSLAQLQLRVLLILQRMSQPAARIGPLEGLQQPMPATAAPPSQTASDALPMLTPLQSLSSQPSASQQFQPQPPPQSVLPIPQASPRIKPPPASGSFSLSQAGMPLWQMLGSAANTPIVGAGMSISNDSLDLDHLAKAAVRKRKQQVQILFSQLVPVHAG